MTESKICTCPSGDGSLRHPCPAHPAVEQAGGDERAAFEYWASDEGLYPKAVERAGNCYKLAQTQSYWMAWQARASLAQPSPAQDEQAEAERPEVVAVMESNGAGGKRLAQRFPIVNVFVGDELMTVAQHERIVVAEKGKTAAAMLESHRQFVRQFEEGTAELIVQRDAALARVAELEKQEPVGEVRESGGTLTAVIVRHSYATKLPVGTKLYAAPVAQAQHSVPIAHEFKRALGLVVAALEADGDRPTSKYALSELKKVLAAAPGKEGV